MKNFIKYSHITDFVLCSLYWQWPLDKTLKLKVLKPKFDVLLTVHLSIILVNNQLNPLNAELNPTCQLLALLAHHILHVSRIRVNTRH